MSKGPPPPKPVVPAPPGGGPSLTTHRVMLDESDFRTLVSGGTVKATQGVVDIEIRLADIGWPRMVICITESRLDQQLRQPPGG